ncbi:MAG: hypothetical protein KDD35_03855, partial [Bdellovibrionales bacterium]|nr:hypothetical protein [Bdellovibrionales bacterium]
AVIVSMINPTDLDTVILKLKRNYIDLRYIKGRLDKLRPFLLSSPGQSTPTPAEKELKATAGQINLINKVFIDSTVEKFIKFTDLLIKNLEVIQHAIQVNNPSGLVLPSSEHVEIAAELEKTSLSLMNLTALLQK